MTKISKKPLFFENLCYICPIMFGQKLKLIRRARGLKQGKIAEALDISQAYLSRLESEKDQPSISLLTRWATAVGAQIQITIK